MLAMIAISNAAGLDKIGGITSTYIDDSAALGLPVPGDYLQGTGASGREPLRSQLRIENIG
jgi:hypothetical protein